MLNRYVTGRTDYINGDLGNSISLIFTWRLSHGKRYPTINRPESPNRDLDPGILR